MTSGKPLPLSLSFFIWNTVENKLHTGLFDDALLAHSLHSLCSLCSWCSSSDVLILTFWLLNVSAQSYISSGHPQSPELKNTPSHSLTPGFLNLGITDILGQTAFDAGAVLGITTLLTASAASTAAVDGSSRPRFSVVTTKNVSRYYSQGKISHPVGNNCANPLFCLSFL